MTEYEKRAHDVAIAIMQENIQPIDKKVNLIEYVKSWTNFYLNVYNSAKINIENQKQQ